MIGQPRDLFLGQDVKFSGLRQQNIGEEERKRLRHTYIHTKAGGVGVTSSCSPFWCHCCQEWSSQYEGAKTSIFGSISWGVERTKWRAAIIVPCIFFGRYWMTIWTVFSLNASGCCSFFVLKLPFPFWCQSAHIGPVWTVWYNCFSKAWCGSWPSLLSRMFCRYVQVHASQ